MGVLGEIEGGGVVGTSEQGGRQQYANQQHIQELQSVGQQVGAQGLAQQSKLQSTTPRGQQSADGDRDGQPQHQGGDRQKALGRDPHTIRPRSLPRSSTA